MHAPGLNAALQFHGFGNPEFDEAAQRLAAYGHAVMTDLVIDRSVQRRSGEIFNVGVIHHAASSFKNSAAAASSV
jgi:hypothetical protein